MGYNRTSFKKGHPSYRQIKKRVERSCLICDKQFFVWQNVIDKGYGKYCSGKCRGRAVGNLFVTLKKGSNNPQWRGGVTKGRLKLTNTIEYKNWRWAVYERDNYTCQSCGVRGGKLNADHVIPWWKEEKLRFDVSNGQTLCQACHLLKTREEHKLSWVNQFASARL